MKKIINGKLYDTDTAKLVHSIEEGHCRDFGWYREELYRKRTGEFFLCGEGGPASPYNVFVRECNMWSGDCKIVPIPFERARAWAEEHMSAEQYVELFTVTEDSGDEKTTVTFSLPQRAVESLRLNASKDGISMSALLERMILEGDKS